MFVSDKVVENKKSVHFIVNNFFLSKTCRL